MRIYDAAGASYGALVDMNNRLHTQSVSRSELLEATLKGVSYNFNTGAITLTSANESAIGYFDYQGDDPFVLTEILFILGATTGGAGDGTARVYRNPTSGTIIDNAVPVNTAANRNFSSSIVVDGNLYKGVEGDTISGGSTFAESTRSSFGTVITFDAGPIVLEKGNTLALSWQPPAGNTSQVVKVAGTGYTLSSAVGG